MHSNSFLIPSAMTILTVFYLVLRKDRKQFLLILYPILTFLCGTVLALFLHESDFRQTIMYVALTELLIFCTISDIEERIIPDAFCAAILISGLISPAMLKYRLISGAFSVVFVLVIAAVSKKTLGGGDLKLIAACSFVLGGVEILTAVISSLVLSLITYGVMCLCGHKPANKALPLAPFIAVGCYGVLLLII